MLKAFADALDILAAIAAVGAIVFLFANLPSVESGPAFIQIGMFSLLIGVIPYCIAGAFHRLWSRR